VRCDVHVNVMWAGGSGLDIQRNGRLGWIVQGRLGRGRLMVSKASLTPVAFLLVVHR
jgi:hypothetical protein